MGLESTINWAIKEEEELQGLEWHWSNGTLFADTNDIEQVGKIKEIIEENTMNTEVEVNCLKATTTEPWDQYAFDLKLIA